MSESIFHGSVRIIFRPHVGSGAGLTLSNDLLHATQCHRVKPFHLFGLQIAKNTLFRWKEWATLILIRDLKTARVLELIYQLSSRQTEFALRRRRPIMILLRCSFLGKLLGFMSLVGGFVLCIFFFFFQFYAVSSHISESKLNHKCIMEAGKGHFCEKKKKKNIYIFLKNT